MQLSTWLDLCKWACWSTNWSQIQTKVREPHRTLARRRSHFIVWPLQSCMSTYEHLALSRSAHNSAEVCSGILCVSLICVHVQMFKCCMCQGAFVSSGTVCVKMAQICSRASHELEPHGQTKTCIVAINGWVSWLNCIKKICISHLLLCFSS